MKCYDFEYDGIRLSDVGYTICKFSSVDLETITNGAQITWTKSDTLKNNKFDLLSSTYTDSLYTTIQICKTTCDRLYVNQEISVAEIRELMTWLNRKEFHKFKFLMDDYYNLYFEASFNVNLIRIGYNVIGLELQMATNRPFALQDDEEINFHIVNQDQKIIVNSKSDEEGTIYPDMEITINQDGNLIITNGEKITVINNCKTGEVININYPIISTSYDSHKIQNDFNWEFPKLATKFTDRTNIYTISIPCDIVFKYIPVAKITI